MHSRDASTDPVSTSRTERADRLADAASVRVLRHRCVRHFGQNPAAIGEPGPDGEAGLRTDYTPPAIHAPVRDSAGSESRGTVGVWFVRRPPPEGDPAQHPPGPDDPDAARPGAVPL